MNRFLSWLLLIPIGAYFAFASLDYVVRNSSGASILSSIGMMIIGLSLVSLLINGNGFHINKTNKRILYLMLFPFIAYLWAEDSAVALGRCMTIIKTVSIFLLVYSFTFSKKQIRILEMCFIIGACAACLYIIRTQGIVEMLGGRRIFMGEDREASDPNGICARLYLPFVLSFFYFLRNGSKYIKAFYLGICTLILFIILLCASRGALVGILVCFFTYIYLQPGKKNKTKYFILFLLMILAIMPFAKEILPESLYMRLFSTESYTSDFDGHGTRSDIWRMLVTDIIPQSPIIGYGPGGVYFEIGRRLGIHLYAAHNSYLCMIGEYGIFYLPVFIMFLRDTYTKLKENEEIQHIAMLFGMLVILFFLDAYFSKYFWNILLYIYLYMNMKQKGNHYKLNKKGSNK